MISRRNFLSTAFTAAAALTPRVLRAHPTDPLADQLRIQHISRHLNKLARANIISQSEVNALITNLSYIDKSSSANVVKRFVDQLLELYSQDSRTKLGLSKEDIKEIFCKGDFFMKASVVDHLHRFVNTKEQPWWELNAEYNAVMNSIKTYDGYRFKNGNQPLTLEQQKNFLKELENCRNYKYDKLKPLFAGPESDTSNN